MDRLTLAAYDAAAADYARDWHDQPAPEDLYALLGRYFGPGPTADIGCGGGREVAWLTTQGFAAFGYDPSFALLTEARRRYPGLAFRSAALPELAGITDGAFANVMCETVLMHLPPDAIAPAVTRLVAILRPGGMLYLGWRVTAGVDRRDPRGRLYAAFEARLVTDALAAAGATILHDEDAISASSGSAVHRIIARRADA